MGLDDFYAVDDVSFTVTEDGGTKTGKDADDVFDALYGDLVDRLEERDYYTPKRRADAAELEKLGRLAEEDFHEWQERLRDVDVTMTLTRDAGTRYEESYELNVAPRTDFTPDNLATPPSIVKVLDGDEMRFAIRKWTYYDGDDILPRLARHGKHFKRNAHDDDFYESVGADAYDAAAFNNKLTMIPELYLESALHKQNGLYDRDDVQPVTPYNVRVLQVDDNQAFALRPWLHGEFDGGISHRTEAKRFGEHYGTCEALGLVGCFDREDEFYRDHRDGDNFTVFIDPELMGYTDRQSWFSGSDLDDYQRELKKHGNATGQFNEMMKEHKWATAERLASLDYHLLDELPASIDMELFPEEKRLPAA